MQISRSSQRALRREYGGIAELFESEFSQVLTPGTYKISVLSPSGSLLSYLPIDIKNSPPKACGEGACVGLIAILEVFIQNLCQEPPNSRAGMMGFTSLCDRYIRLRREGEGLARQRHE